MHLLYPMIEKARGLVVGSPTYNYNITPEMKAFIDRFYPFFDFSAERPGPYTSRLAAANRKSVTIGVCEQNEASEMGFTIPAMSDAFRAIGYEVVGEVAVTGHFAKGSVASDRRALSQSESAGAALAAALGG
jgi:multimeric flavodoxin WrbA